MVPAALVLMWYETAESSIVLTNTVHDSIVGEFSPVDRELFRSLAVQCMTTGVIDYLRRVYRYEWTTHLGVGIKCSKNWGEGEEFKYNVPATEALEFDIAKYRIKKKKDTQEAIP